MNKKFKKVVLLAVSTLLTSTMMFGCGQKSSGASSSSEGETVETTGKVVTLNYAIWDKNQEPGMRAIADAFEAKNENIKIKVEITPWSEYWTKMEAAATGGALPDVFWMHTKEFIKYSEGNQLMDITDKIKNSEIVDLNNFPKGLVDVYTLDNKNYAMPKDYDTIALWYNKALFDEKQIAYPDDTWDWNKLLEVAQQLTDKDKGNYGFAAPVQDQEGYYNFIFQNGGYVLSDDQKKSGFDSPETMEAIQFMVDLSQKYGVSPTQDKFAETTATQYFETGKVAMGLFGSWMVSEFTAIDYVKENCDLAVIPKNKEKATIYNGLGNSISSNTKYPEEAWKFVEFLGTEEANLIQAEYGAAIPAFKGTEAAWSEFGKDFNLAVYPEMLEYGVIYPNSKSSSKWREIEFEVLTKVWMKELTVEDGCKELAKRIDEVLATE